MSTVVFIYAKNSNKIFLSIDDAISFEGKLKVQGFTHLATVDPSIILSKINDICLEKYSSDEKINKILQLLTTDQ